MKRIKQKKHANLRKNYMNITTLQNEAENKEASSQKTKKKQKRKKI